MTNYSQNNEQEHILQYFADKSIGHFLDIGAYDGITFSNTRSLVELGWSGVMVEPSPDSFLNLCKLYSENSRVILVNVALSLKSGINTFHCTHGDAISTVNCESHLRKWSGANFQSFFINTLSTKDFFEKFGTNYDFINIDVEGNNLDILSSVLSLGVRPKLMCVEHDGHVEKISNMLKNVGLTNVVLINGENLVVGV